MADVVDISSDVTGPYENGREVRFTLGTWGFTTIGADIWFKVGTEECLATGYYNKFQDEFPDDMWGTTFTPVSTQTVSKITLRLRRYDAPSPGQIRVSIRATSGGLPVGGDLASGLTDGDTLPIRWSWEEREISIDSIELTEGVLYAIVVKVLYVLPKTPGHIWTEANSLHYIDASGIERAKEGADTGSNGDAGYLWVEGTYLHYIDENGDERRQEGTAEGATGKTGGQFWIESTKLRYIDADGDERYIEGAVV